MNNFRDKILVYILVAALLLSACSRASESINTDLAGTGRPTMPPRATATPVPKKEGSVNTPIYIPGTEPESTKVPEQETAGVTEPAGEPGVPETDASVSAGSLEIQILATPTPRTDYAEDFQTVYQKTGYGYRDISHEETAEDDALSQAVLSYLAENPMSREYLPKLIAVHYEGAYTEEEITAAIDRLGIDFSEVALAFAVNELEEGCHSEDDLRYTMEILRFTEDEISSAMGILQDYDWSIEADEYVESLLTESYASIEYIRSEMETAGFTKKQIDASTKKLETMDWDEICLSQMRKWVTEYGWNISEAATFMADKGWSEERLAEAKKTLSAELKSGN